MFARRVCCCSIAYLKRGSTKKRKGSIVFSWHKESSKLRKFSDIDIHTRISTKHRTRSHRHSIMSKHRHRSRKSRYASHMRTAKKEAAHARRQNLKELCNTEVDERSWLREKQPRGAKECRYWVAWRSKIHRHAGALKHRQKWQASQCRYYKDTGNE